MDSKYPLPLIWKRVAVEGRERGRGFVNTIPGVGLPHIKSPASLPTPTLLPLTRARAHAGTRSLAHIHPPTRTHVARDARANAHTHVCVPIRVRMWDTHAHARTRVTHTHVHTRLHTQRATSFNGSRMSGQNFPIGRRPYSPNGLRDIGKTFLNKL